MHTIAIFGGTFDPIHKGHLQTSLTLQAYFGFDSYIFLPCKMPTIKPPTHASSEQRISMIQLAIKDYPYFKLDLREIMRDTPSYMVETLESFRLQNPNASIILIIGYDAFLSLPRWFQWEKLITFAHLLIINRLEFSHQPIPKNLHQFLKKYERNNKENLLTTPAGSIFLFDAGNYSISSSLIRDEIRKGVNVKNKLPFQVYEYIKSQGLYQ